LRNPLPRLRMHGPKEIVIAGLLEALDRQELLEELAKQHDSDLWVLLEHHLVLEVLSVL